MSPGDLADAVTWAADIIDPAEDEIRERGEGAALDEFREAVRFLRHYAARQQQAVMDGIQPAGSPSEEDEIPLGRPAELVPCRKCGKSFLPFREHRGVCVTCRETEALEDPAVEEK